MPPWRLRAGGGWEVRRAGQGRGRRRAAQLGEPGGSPELRQDPRGFGQGRRHEHGCEGSRKARASSSNQNSGAKDGGGDERTQGQPPHSPNKKRPRTAKAETAREAQSADDPAPVQVASTDAAAARPSAPVSEAANPEFRWPARGRIIQAFKPGGNDGINIAVPEGTSVKAAESGVVAYAGNELKGYGNLILIRHPNGFVSAYANTGDIEVKRGETVKRGQTIAKSGQSGNVASPQLHFELRKGTTPVDPNAISRGGLTPRLNAGAWRRNSSGLRRKCKVDTQFRSVAGRRPQHPRFVRRFGFGQAARSA